MRTQTDRERARSTLGDVLARWRGAGFVGRDRELVLLDELLDPRGGARLLFLHGEAGVGKTVLLQAYQREAERRGIECVYHDCRDVPGERGPLAAVIDESLPRDNGTALLMLDTFEAVADRERWFRETYLPGLPEDVRIVIAGRTEPAPQWRTDPGWTALMRTRSLHGFSAEETAAHLAYHGVDADRAPSVHSLTRGHPLAVALVGELLRDEPERSLNLEDAPSVVQELVGHYVTGAPGETERQALYVAAIARNLTESMLARVLDLEAGHDLFEWLRSFPFMRLGPEGLQPHELVGNALRAELKWRAPCLHRDLVRRVVDYLIEQLADDGSPTLVEDYLFAIREAPGMASIFVVEQDTGLRMDVPDPEDRPVMAAMVERYEGPESRRWFEFWARSPRAEMRVLRDAAGHVSAFVVYVDATAPTPEEQGDPAVARFTHYHQCHAPLRTGERAYLCRYLIARDSYQAASPAVTQLFAYNALRGFRMPAMAFQASVRGEDPVARMQGRAFGVPPLEGCEFELGGGAYFLMGHDLRLQRPAQWLRNITERMLATGADTAGDVRSGTVLDRSGFDAAVNDALRTLGRGERPSDCRLAESCILRQRDDADAATDVIERVLAETVEAMKHCDRDATHGRVLERTFLKPIGKQRAVAAAVGLSYGTYRRRLREAVPKLVERLWNEELAAARASRG